MHRRDVRPVRLARRPDHVCVVAQLSRSSRNRAARNALGVGSRLNSQRISPLGLADDGPGIIVIVVHHPVVADAVGPKTTI